VVPVNVSIVIARPRDEVFAYLVDIANHWEFTDHFIEDFHLTREDSIGVGAGARFALKLPLNRFPWAGMSFVEVDPPRQIGAAGDVRRWPVVDRSFDIDFRRR